MEGMKEVLLLCLAAMMVPCTSQECSFGSELDPTSRLMETGHFLDLDRPVPCSGTLVRWHFCYYASTVALNSVQRLNFRVWRPQSGNMYTRILSQVLSIRVQSNDTIVCNMVTLDPANQIQVLEGDVYAANVESREMSAPLLAAPPTGRRLFRDTRDFFDIRSNRVLRQNQLEPVEGIGVHLFADVITPTMPPPTPASSSVTTSQPTTIFLKTTASQTVETSSSGNGGLDISSNFTTSTQITETQASDMEENIGGTSQGEGRGSTGKAVVAVIVVLLLVGVVIAVAVAIAVLHVKRRRKDNSSDLFHCCVSIKKSKTIIALDNVMYRVGSQHIAPFFSKSPSQRKKTDTYEYPDSTVVPSSPAAPTKRNLDMILTSNGSINPYEEVLDDNTYSIPVGSPMAGCTNHAIVTQVSMEHPVPSPHASSVDVHQYPGNSVGEGVVSHQRMESADYIYMSSCPEEGKSGVLSTEEIENEYIGPEEYQSRLVYDSMQYRAMLKKATLDAVEEESPYKVPPSREDEIYIFISQQKIKIIPRETITVNEVIGSGQFGEVDKGWWKSVKRNSILEVALKTLPKDQSTEDKLKLLQEAMIMGQFSHPNVVQLYGIVSYGEPLILVMEYMENRDLKKYLLRLKSKQEKTSDDSLPDLLLGFSEQVALGMHYLASKKLVHRDLAARNIFVSNDNTCKIGDFGMAKDISNNGFYQGNDGKVPLKWTAPEAIQLKKYSIASDVWSYGCLLYEIWSMGAKPYKGLRNEEAISKISCGYRLPPPPGCPQAIYTLMMQCWHPAPSARPKYQAILTSLLEDPKKVLHIPQQDISSHSLAHLLGAPLAAGLNMYSDIQLTYQDTTDLQDPDYEYMDTDSDSDTQ